MRERKVQTYRVCDDEAVCHLCSPFPWNIALDAYGGWNFIVYYHRLAQDGRCGRTRRSGTDAVESNAESLIPPLQIGSACSTVPGHSASSQKEAHLDYCAYFHTWCSLPCAKRTPSRMISSVSNTTFIPSM